MTLNAFPGLDQPLTERHLRAATNDPNQTRPIVFTVRSGPRLGRLVLGDRESPLNFTQTDIDAGRLGYRHTATAAHTAWSQTDSFLFDVWTEYAESTLRSRLFSVSLSYDHVNGDNVNWLMVLGSAEVDEGASVVIRRSALDVSPLQRRLSAAGDVNAAVQYVVVEGPRHGTLQMAAAGRLAARDRFSQEAVDSGRLSYEHDGTDTTSDQFSFSLDFTSERNGNEPPPLESFGFNISVHSVDDQPFQLQTPSPHIELVQGSARSITSEVLRTLDDDTPPEQLIYVVDVAPTNGHLQHADDAAGHVTQFSQSDVDQLKMSFVSDGSLANSTFRFHVSDGVHKPLHKVIIPFSMCSSRWLV